jgi:hypothetical protein
MIKTLWFSPYVAIQGEAIKGQPNAVLVFGKVFVVRCPNCSSLSKGCYLCD